ncbi:MAG: LETM1 domain-containing protein [Myxococcaceae bacterium]|jgi:hypothetical protein|nr:LETM1 domain-containing protein [Myxococcaceae bacterium]
MERGWLQEVLGEAVRQHTPDVTSQSYRDALSLPAGPARARRYLRGILRESGLLYGTPSMSALEPAKDATKARPTGPEEQLFLAVLQTCARIALDLAILADAPPGPRAEQLLGLFAAFSHHVDDAEDVHRRIERMGKAWPLPGKVWSRTEAGLEERSLSLAADPYYGLVLHNGAIFADATRIGRLAIAWFTAPRFPRGRIERLNQFSDQQKALLVEVLIGLVCAERKPSFPARRAILRQIDDLQLPDELADSTREYARKAFERAPSMKKVLVGVRSRDMKRFLVDQALLASIVDGRRSEQEQAWTRALATRLGFSADEVKRLELQLAEFYAKHRHVMDVFTLSAGAEVMGEELVDSIATQVRKNSRALWNEIRETGELSVLLARAARGQKLTADEKRRMREQLIDVAKAVPALAIFTAPGGLLLLLALAKVMPFDLLPSSFKDEPVEADDEPPTRH